MPCVSQRTIPIIHIRSNAMPCVSQRKISIIHRDAMPCVSMATENQTLYFTNPQRTDRYVPDFQLHKIYPGRKC